MILNILSIIFSFLSAIFWLKSSLVTFPQAPCEGKILESKPFVDMFNALNKMSRLNKLASILLAISIFFQIVILALDIVG